MTASNLDIERFRELHATMTGGSTEGEKAAAKIHATLMAKRAGMTLLAAIAVIEQATAQYLPRRTNADKAADVQSMLADSPGLADREIARRVGVSAQTVSNWRARLKAKSDRSIA